MNTTGEHKTRSSGKNINASSFFVNHNYLTLFCRIETSRCRGECEFFLCALYYSYLLISIYVTNRFRVKKKNLGKK